jgi:phospholipid/cholesterol/gamma-HCH transport system permease protein
MNAATACWRGLGKLGTAVRWQASSSLSVAALAWGVLREAPRPASWRRTVRAELRREMRQSVAGGLGMALMTATLIGLVMVSQALYWLSNAGEPSLIDTVLVIVLVRELAPLLVGVILLRRSGVVAVAELGEIALSGHARALQAMGLDLFQLLVLPRAVALAAASFTLGVLFVATTVTTGYITGSLAGAVQVSFPVFINRLLSAMHWRDFAVFPAKLLLIGLLVALVACLTGLQPRASDDAADLLPRAFVRGMTAILVASIVLDFAV